MQEQIWKTAAKPFKMSMSDHVNNWMQSIKVSESVRMLKNKIMQSQRIVLKICQKCASSEIFHSEMLFNQVVNYEGETPPPCVQRIASFYVCVLRTGFLCLANCVPFNFK